MGECTHDHAAFGSDGDSGDLYGVPPAEDAADFHRESDMYLYPCSS